jgi:dCTP deaminase
MEPFPNDRQGVFPIQWLEAAVDGGVISSATDIPPENFQPASLDLRLGPTAYRLQSSFLPSRADVERRLEALAMDQIDLRGDGGILETNRPYLIPLLEEVRLPQDVHARANPKSSTGRLDVFTRVITDRGQAFDDIRPGYQGKLYLEVVPLSFTVRVREGLSLNQLRVARGNEHLDDGEVRALHGRTPILFRDAVPVDGGELRVRGRGVFLGLDLQPDAAGSVGFRAKRNSRVVDMSRTDHRPEDYWEPVRGEHGGVVLEPEQFYLLMSAESVRIPPEVASEMTAYDPTSGELRTHYAGFFDPGFGHAPAGGTIGSRAALEVRAHDVPFLVEHGQPVCKIQFERMAEVPDRLYGWDLGSSYQDQVVTLGKHFLRPAGREPRQLRLLNPPAAAPEAARPTSIGQ